MLHVAFFEPRIPGNTGSAIRLAAGTGSTLHLVEPLGFDLSEAKLRRAGLDYHDLAHVVVHKNLEALLATVPGRVLRLHHPRDPAPHRPRVPRGRRAPVRSGADRAAGRGAGAPPDHRPGAHPDAPRPAVHEPVERRSCRHVRGVATAGLRGRGLAVVLAQLPLLRVRRRCSPRSGPACPASSSARGCPGTGWTRGCSSRRSAGSRPARRCRCSRRAAPWCRWRCRRR